MTRIPAIPERGDNFLTRGPWRILSGATWHGWQCAAVEAERRAAASAGDELAVRRAELRLAVLKRRGVLPPSNRTPTGPTRDGG